MSLMVNKRSTIALSFILAGSGFLLPFWPLEVLAVLFAAGTGHPVVTVILGLLLDLGSGTPTGVWRYLYFPFTILSLLAIVVRSVGTRFILRKSKQPSL